VFLSPGNEAFALLDKTRTRRCPVAVRSLRWHNRVGSLARPTRSTAHPPASTGAVRRPPASRERRPTSPAVRLPGLSPSASSRSAADAPGPPRHHVAPRGGRRYRHNASRQQSGTPTACGRHQPDPGVGREVDHYPSLSLGRFRRPGRHSWPGWFPRGTSLRLQPLPAPEIPGNTSKPKGTPRKYQNGSSS
jgi:hypothetical protein